MFSKGRRGRDRDAGGNPAPLEGDPDTQAIAWDMEKAGREEKIEEISRAISEDPSELPGETP